AGESAGGRGNYKRIAKRIREITGGSHLDYFLLTHFHGDHVGSADTGLAGLIDDEGIRIDTAVDIGDEGSEFTARNRPTYKTYVDNMSRWLSEQRVQHRVRPQFGTNQIKLGGLALVNIVEFAGRTSDADQGALAAVAAEHPQQYEGAPANENDLSIAMI